MYLSLTRYLRTAATIMACFSAAMSFRANPAMADTQKVEIRNNSGETRKICMHKKPISVIPLACVTLKKGDRIFWDRGYEYSGPFSVKVYRPRKLIDKFLYNRDVPADTGNINIATGNGFGFSRFKNIITYYRAEFCNQNHDQTIWLSMGYDTPNARMSEGWWGLKKGECKTIPVTRRLRSAWQVHEKTLPRIYYYARTYGDKPIHWSDGPKARLFCLDLDKKFTARHSGTGIACDTGDEPQPFRYLQTAKKGGEEQFKVAF